jgi:hypothetical protein
VDYQKPDDCKGGNRIELLDYCIKNLSPAITKSWVKSFSSRHADENFQMKSSPQENQRPEVM